jgi:hypothetical protein
MRVLAHRAGESLAIAVVLALLTYLIGYHRHRAWTVEGLAGRAKVRLSGSMLPGWFMPNPRQQAIAGFMIQTLARSSHHRMILMGYGGLGFAALLTGLIGMVGVVERERLAVAGFLYFHIVSLLVLLIGGRHLFSLPTELKANWIFQITEREGRGAWLSAVDRFVLFWGMALMLILPLPLEVRLLGWHGMAEAALFLVLGLTTYEWVFYSWEKLPFTCSHLPGKTPMWIVVMQFFGLITLVPVVHSLLLATLYNGVAFVIVLAVLLAAWEQIHGMRRQGQAELRLKYDEVPDSAIYALNLLK